MDNFVDYPWNKLLTVCIKASDETDGYAQAVLSIGLTHWMCVIKKRAYTHYRIKCNYMIKIILYWLSTETVLTNYYYKLII